jgi:preprotein translocase subunit SecF
MFDKKVEVNPLKNTFTKSTLIFLYPLQNLFYHTLIKKFTFAAFFGNMIGIYNLFLAAHLWR